MSITLSDTEALCPPVDETRPFVEFEPSDNIWDAFRHADGSITYIVSDEYSEHANPRTDRDCNIAVLVQTNTRCIDFDEDSEGLGAAWDRWDGRDRERYLARYVSIFRPDILHLAEWHAGEDSRGFGYVMRDRWDEHMVPSGRPMTTAELTEYLDDDGTRKRAEAAFDAEVRDLDLWCSGYVFAARHVRPGEPEIVYGDHGAYVTGWEQVEEWCHGFLGYHHNRDICGEMTASPITEVLA